MGMGTYKAISIQNLAFHLFGNKEKLSVAADNGFSIFELHMI
jgi:hypothetical protein